MRHFGWHTFRHTHATLLKGNIEDVKVVQELKPMFLRSQSRFLCQPSFPRSSATRGFLLFLQPQRTGPDAGLIVCHVVKALANHLQITTRWLTLVGSGTLRCPAEFLRQLLAEEPGTNQQKTRDRANWSHTRLMLISCCSGGKYLKRFSVPDGI